MRDQEQVAAVLNMVLLLPVAVRLILLFAIGPLLCLWTAPLPQAPLHTKQEHVLTLQAAVQ